MQALFQAEARDHELSHAEAVRHEASLRAHVLVCEGLITNGLRYAIMTLGGVNKIAGSWDQGPTQALRSLAHQR